MSCKPKCLTCERLQGAALEVVGRWGAGALSMEAVAERAGLSADEGHAHYATAAACVYEVYEHASARLLGVVFEAFHEDPGWERGLERAWHGLVELIGERPLEARLCFVEAPRVDRELRRGSERRRRQLVSFLENEYERRRGPQWLSGVQIELLAGAGFHTVSEALAADGSEQLAALTDRLGELAGVFELAAAA